MTFDEVLAQVKVLLQQEQRVSYRGLKRRFALDEEYLEDLKEELIGAQRLATDEDGRFLVWSGDTIVPRDPLPVASPPLSTPSSQLPDAPPQTLDMRRSEGERRQLTVEFIDLVGSTTLSQQLDPEDYHARVVAYQAACHHVIKQYDGHIAQYLGDGVLVYFGYPIAHEDDAARAVRSGLEIVTVVHQLAYTPPLQVRIGIHTGPVVVGEIGAGERTERLALGETPNIAARIQGQAAPNEVVISTATYRLVEGLFECEDRGQPELKGVSTPLILYCVIKEGEAQSRFEVVTRKGLTPLIGREHEYGLLSERWEQAKSGEGQVVLLSGEPGIGKSRLVEALKESVEYEGAFCLELRCSPYHQNSALYPIIEHLQRVLGFQSGDTSEEKLRKLVGATPASSLPPKAIPLLAALLKLPHPEGYPPITLSSQKQKEKTQEALVVWLCSEAIQQAMIYAWEDLHWADPSTLELLTLFLNHVPTTRLFVVLTFRPEFTPPWGAYSYLSQLTLSRLGRSHVEVMVEKITSGKALPKEIVQQIVSKTDGIPLFVEELTKTVLESVESIESIRSEGKLTRSSLQLGIPATLQDALMARLDRLGPAKEIAKFGATIGREFDYVLLRAVSSLNEEALQQGLKQLVEAELVYQSGVPPQARYLFKHALVQDIAYQSLLKSRRHQLHEQVAQVLAEQFPETVESQPELVAHHYTEAGLVEQAIPYWQQAGERANQSSAYTEAVGHLTKELALLKTLADTPEHIKQELTLQLTLGDALAAVKGYAAPEVGKAATRARELCQQLGETPQLPSMLYRLSLFYMIRGEVQTAHELAKQMLRLAQSLQEQHLLAHAHTRLGWTLYDLGELTSARPHLAEAIALCDPQQHPRCSVKAYYPRVECLSYTAGTLWHLGYPDQALQRSREAVAVAEGLSRPHLLAYALGAAALFHSFRREELLARERAEEAITVSTEHGFPFWLGYGTTVRGWALAEQGQVEEGITQMQQGLAAFRALRSGVHLPYFLARLAEAYRQGEQAEEGLTVLDEALAVVGQTGERVNEAELYRLKGELTQQKLQVASSEVLTPESQAEVESCFLKAVEIARHQQAKSLELRAAMSLVKLWRQQGKQKQAHEMLAEIYGWFTEGFDTKDLQDARALLDELS